LYQCTKLLAHWRAACKSANPASGYCGLYLAVRNKLSTKALSSLTRGREYWRTFFSLQSPHDALDVTAACRALMERIHQDCRYESASADTHTPVLQALEQRKGVCQDFAHIRKLPSRWRQKTSSRLCWVEEVVACSQFFGHRLFRSISSRGTKNPAQR